MTKKTTQKTDILTAIKEQHKLLRKCIRVVKSESAEDDEKQESLIEFIPLLKMHSEAEEKTIYAKMSEKAEDEDQEQTVLEAHVEHSLAKQLVSDLEGLNYQSEWNPEIAAKAKVLVELVEHHAEEEEDEFFEAVRETFERSERQDIGMEFLEACEEANVQSKTAPKGKSRNKSDSRPELRQ